MVRSEPDGVFSKRSGALEPLGDAAQFLVRRRGTASKEREHVLHPIDNSVMSTPSTFAICARSWALSSSGSTAPALTYRRGKPLESAFSGLASGSVRELFLPRGARSLPVFRR
jgi:hypothetical protein